MTNEELVVFVKSLKSSLIYCAPEAVEELLFDKLHPYIVGATKRIAYLESKSAPHMLAVDKSDLLVILHLANKAKRQSEWEPTPPEIQAFSHCCQALLFSGMTASEVRKAIEEGGDHAATA